MKTIKLIKYLPKEDWQGDARLYQCNPPMKDDRDNNHEYVVISATNVMFSGPETFIFSSDKNGKVTKWGELNGSTKGTLNHEKAIMNAGYTLIE